MKVSISVNGRQRTDDVEPRVLLVHYLREVCDQRAANVGCDTSSCGACTVLVDGEAVKSCTLLCVQADGSQILTAEGLTGANGELHPVQAAFHAEHGLQCGFCTPRHDDGHPRVARAEPDSDRTAGPRRPRGQPVSLHGLSQHRARRARGR